MASDRLRYAHIATISMPVPPRGRLESVGGASCQWRGRATSSLAAVCSCCAVRRMGQDEALKASRLVPAQHCILYACAAQKFCDRDPSGFVPFARVLSNGIAIGCSAPAVPVPSVHVPPGKRFQLYMCLVCCRQCTPGGQGWKSAYLDFVSGGRCSGS